MIEGLRPEEGLGGRGDGGTTARGRKVGCRYGGTKARGGLSRCRDGGTKARGGLGRCKDGGTSDKETRGGWCWDIGT